MIIGTDILGQTAIKIKHLFKEAKSDRETQRELKVLPQELVDMKLEAQEKYIVILERKVDKFNLVKELLK